MKAQNKYFLARWLDGKLPDDELKKLVTDHEFHEYVRLRDVLSVSQISAPDIEDNFRRTKEKLADGLRPKVRRLIPRYAVISAIAACIVIGIVLFQTLTFQKGIVTLAGHQTSIALPDGSFVRLNSGSQIQSIKLFSLNRKVKLAGEAFFRVSKGSSFVVQTDQGEVSVLGTSFNVISRNGYFEVICYEGRVQVSTATKITTLTAGEAFRASFSHYETWRTAESEPGWLSGESRFESAPLGLVLMQLGCEFGYTVKLPDSYKNARFTGTFSRSDLTTALKSVLMPMVLSYQIEGKTIVVHP